MSTPTDARGLRIRIADDMRALIETGELGPGEQVPSIAILRARYQCSAEPVRGAIDLLQQQGLVEYRPGLGIFVRQRPKARRLGIERYRRSVWMGGRKLLDAEVADQGLRADPQINRFIGQAPAPPAVADRYGVPPGTMMHVRRRTTGYGGRHNQLADSYYPLDVLAAAPMLGEDETGPGGGWARLADAGFHLATVREEKSLRMPTSPESDALRLPIGTPVLDLTRTTRDATGRVIEVMLAVIAGDMIYMDDEFPIPD